MCNRCAKCCRSPEVNNGMWLDNTDITDEQIEILRRERGKYPENKVDCGVLVFEQDGLASCLIRKILGHKFLPRACKKYSCVKENEKKE